MKKTKHTKAKPEKATVISARPSSKPEPSSWAATESTLAYYQAPGMIQTEGGSSGSSCSCKMSIEVWPKEMCCCNPAGSPFAGVASASCEGKLVTVLKPDGSYVQGMNWVTFDYQPRKEDCGKLLPFIASGEPDCPPVGVTVPVYKVLFDVLEFNPTMIEDERIKIGFSSSPPWPVAHAPQIEGGNEDLFRIPTAVRVYTSPRSTSNVANQCCAQWSLRFIQNLVEFGPRRVVYSNHFDDARVKQVPALDTGDLGLIDLSYSFAEQVLCLLLEDTPGYSGGRFWWDPFLEMTDNALRGMEDHVTFVTWLVAENDTCIERRYLKWVKWTCQWKAMITVTPESHYPTPLPHHYWEEKLFTILESGDGPGPYTPVFNPIDTKAARVPPGP